MAERVKGEWPGGRPGPVDLVFVAEAPADEEVIFGRPLVGPSGRVHDQMLRVAGIDRSKVATLNVSELELPSDDGAKYNELTEDQWCHDKAVGQEEGFGPWRTEWSQWPQYGKGRWLRPKYFQEIERLERELAIAQPKCIVTLGFTATWALTRQMGGIKQRRGCLTWGEGATAEWASKVLPTLHPAAVLREWGMFSTVAGDYSRAKVEAQTRELVFTPRQLWLRPTVGDLYDWEKRWVREDTVISVDIETSCGQISCIGFSVDQTHAICVPFVDFEAVDRSYWPTVEEELAALQWVMRMLDGPQKKLFQNGPFDVYWIKRTWGRLPRGYDEDTRLMHHALFPELPKSLAFMGSVYAKVNAWKRMREKDSEKRDE